MLSFVTAALAAGSVLCSGIDVVGPKKAVKVPLSANRSQILKSVKSAGLAFERDTVVMEDYIAVDTTGGKRRKVITFKFVSGEFSSVTTDSVFTDKKAAEDYGADLAAALDKKARRRGSMEFKDNSVFYSVPAVICGKRIVSWFVSVEYGKAEHTVYAVAVIL